MTQALQEDENAEKERSFETMNTNFAKQIAKLYCSNELLFRNIPEKKFCKSYSCGPSNKPIPLHDDFWNTLEFERMNVMVARVVLKIRACGM